MDDLKAFAADVRKLVGDESTPMFLEGQSVPPSSAP